MQYGCIFATSGCPVGRTGANRVQLLPEPPVNAIRRCYRKRQRRCCTARHVCQSIFALLPRFKANFLVITSLVQYPLSGAPIALCRYSCLRLASTPLAVAPTACSPYCEVDPFTHPTARWIHSPTHGNEGQRRFCGIPCGCHQTSLGQLSAVPGTSVPLSALLSPHFRPPRHLSYHPRHQGHLLGPLQHFPATPRPSIAKSWPRVVHAAKIFVRPKPETPLPRGA